MKNKKVDWCLRKAERELAEIGRHRGLVKIKPDISKARKHIAKAEHYLEATLFLKEKFSDISASTIFYSAYHSLLAILSKFGYESGNQECTFSLIDHLIDENKIDLDKHLINKMSLLSKKGDEESIIEIREKYQYGTDLSMKKELYSEIIETAKIILGKVKKILEN